MQPSLDEQARPTLTELLDYIESHAATIRVEEMRPDGSFRQARLAELPAPRALYWAFLWIRRGVLPPRV